MRGLRGVPRLRGVPPIILLVQLAWGAPPCGVPPIILSVSRRTVTLGPVCFPFLSYFLRSPLPPHARVGHNMHRHPFGAVVFWPALASACVGLNYYVVPTFCDVRLLPQTFQTVPPSLPTCLGSRLALADSRDLSCVPPTPARSTGT